MYVYSQISASSSSHRHPPFHFLVRAKTSLKLASSLPEISRSEGPSLYMAEKNQNQYHPPAANGYSRSSVDTELSSPLDAEEARRKKRIKWAAYGAAFVVFQTIVIVVFVMVVMKVRRPKFRLGADVTVQTWSSTASSFDITFQTPVRIKNNNFGPYKYDATTVGFTYDSVRVGQLSIPKGKAGFMTTKKLDFTASVNSMALNSTTALSSELSTGVLTLSGEGRMEGKAEIMLIFKKKKATDMNCTMVFDVTTKKIASVNCE
ncbi:hypothetical protein SAY87_021005 [Trapa incisa]|uniref:Late embryogenesis abundant protein LEA-2 subgroup domain-containing protein n=1 Tax=Trapa incisa TaxID=236973 RepID=A0AAN7PNV1_9MYRT|nr:hypothetical protein SAY87_021005 [Trapa incisa]